MQWVALIAHADGDEEIANEFAQPLRDRGYNVDCRGFAEIGESILARENRALRRGGPIVLCGTRRAAGSESIKNLVNAAKFDADADVRVFPVKLETDVDLSSFVTKDIRVADFTKDRATGMQQLLRALSKYYPIETEVPPAAAPPSSQPTKPIVLPYPSLGPLFKGREDFMQALRTISRAATARQSSRAAEGALRPRRHRQDACCGRVRLDASGRLHCSAVRRCRDARGAARQPCGADDITRAASQRGAGRRTPHGCPRLVAINPRLAPDP